MSHFNISKLSTTHLKIKTQNHLLYTRYQMLLIHGISFHIQCNDLLRFSCTLKVIYVCVHMYM